jgi:hypothetical protein
MLDSFFGRQAQVATARCVTWRDCLGFDLPVIQGEPI